MCDQILLVRKVQGIRQGQTNTMTSSLGIICSIIHKRPTSTNVLSLIKRHQATVIGCVPSLMNILLDHPDYKNSMVGVHTLLLGGEPFSKALYPIFYAVLNFS